jgi:hypothetical protein
MNEYFSLQTNRMEAHWYPHKSVNYEQYCHTDEEVLECIDSYISKGLSTSDFEAEKYIVFQKYDFVMHICDKYEVEDWTHLFVTAIINKCDLSLIIHLIAKYNEKKKHNFLADPEQNDVLFACLNTKNLDAFLIFMDKSNLDKKWFDVFENKTLNEAQHCFKAFDMESIHIKRNIVYALLDKDVDRALRLINGGIQVDVWNNFPMRIIITHEDLKSNKELVKVMMQKGAKIPSYITETRRFANYITNKIKQSFVVPSKIPLTKAQKPLIHSTSKISEMNNIKTKINIHQSKLENKENNRCKDDSADDDIDADVCITIHIK